MMKHLSIGRLVALVAALCAVLTVVPSADAASYLSMARGKGEIRSFVSGVAGRVAVKNQDAWGGVRSCWRLGSAKVACNARVTILNWHDDYIYCDQEYRARLSSYGYVNISWVGDADCHY